MIAETLRTRLGLWPVLTAAVLSLSTPSLAFDGAGAVHTATQTAHFWIAYGYRAAPALMLGLALFASIPVLAMAVRIKTRIGRDRDATRRYRSLVHGDSSSVIESDAPDQPAFAFLEVIGPSATRYAILRDMLRIGREDDNDIRIPSKAIHRYHAAIYREEFDDWHIADLSGVEGNGIAVNGQRCSDARLHDGDVIDLGPGKLRFRALAA